MKRFVLIAALALLGAGVIAGPGSAASFNDTVPCPASGALLVCPKAQVGQPYSLQLIATGGCDTYWWEFTVGGLPPGLSLSRTGLISGTPTATGGTEPWVQVHDLTAPEGGPSWCGGDNKSQRQFVFNVAPGLSIQQQSVPGGTIGQAYSQQFTALAVTNLNPVQGSPAQVTWSVKSGSLPAGVTLSPSGQLSGTPTAEGSFTFVVLATGGGGTTDTETETLTVRQPLVLSAFGAAKAEVGAAFSHAQTATGGSGAFTWSISKGALPSGLVLGNDGTITGKPALPGRYSFTVTATDSESRSKSEDVTLVVASKLAVKTSKLKSAHAGVAYRSKILTSGGAGPFTWRVAGKLPAGFRLGKTGLLFGTPTKAGVYRATVTVVDSLGVSAKKSLTLVVK